MRLALSLLLLLVLVPSARGEDGVAFAAWSPETFAKAKRERRIIVLTVSTSWCHWCHVMKRETYGDPRVKRVLAESFLPVDVDADARPDLAERFRNYRWPATAFLTSDGVPITAFRGHRYAPKFLEILADVERRVRAGGPYPGFKEPSRAGGALPRVDKAGLRRLRDVLRSRLDRHWDEEHAGWGTKQKYPVPEPVEYGLLMRAIDPEDRQPFARSLRTLRATEALIDPVWGGVYQYSVGPTWRRWHPEKIMSVNAGALHTFAIAARLDASRREAWTQDADAVVRWLERFMRAPSGAYFATQDADAPRLPGERYYRLSEAERRRYGVPEVDRRIFARENGLVAQALVTRGDVEGAARVMDAIRRRHRRDDGMYRHAADDDGPLYLVDQAEVGRALLALHQHAPSASLLAEARVLADGMETRFRDPASGGFFDRTDDPAAVGVFRDRLVSLEPGATAARFLLELGAITEASRYEVLALAAIRAVGTTRQIEQHFRYVGGLLIAVERAIRPWARIDVRGASSLRARARALARHPLVVWDVAEDGPSLAVVCGRGYCSDPVETEGALRSRVTSVLRGDP